MNPNPQPHQNLNQSFPKYYRHFPVVTVLLFAFIGACISMGALWAVNHAKYTQEADLYRTRAQQEREYKQQLQALLDRQLNNNDELVRAQTTLNTELSDYMDSVTKSYRVIDGRVELLPGANAKELQAGQEQVKLEQENVESRINKATKDKEEAKKERDRIFNESNQNLQNRADPRDGTRE